MANLIANRRLARAIGDAAWTELARQLVYKAAWFRAELVVCDRWFASTKTSSARLRSAERLASIKLSRRPSRMIARLVVMAPVRLLP